MVLYCQKCNCLHGPYHKCCVHCKGELTTPNAEVQVKYQ